MSDSAAVSIAHLGGIVAQPPEPSTALGVAVPTPGAQPAPPAPRVEDDDDEEVRNAREKKARERKDRRAKKARKRDDDDDGEDDPDDDDDDDEEESSAASVTGRARRRERARCKAIFDAALATGVPGARGLAAHFAFATSMKRSSAIGAMEAALAAMPRVPARAGLDARMEGAAIPRVAADAGQGGEMQPWQRMQRARAKARGEKA